MKTNFIDYKGFLFSFPENWSCPTLISKYTKPQSPVEATYCFTATFTNLATLYRINKGATQYLALQLYKSEYMPTAVIKTTAKRLPLENKTLNGLNEGEGVFFMFDIIVELTHDWNNFLGMLNRWIHYIIMSIKYSYTSRALYSLIMCRVSLLCVCMCCWYHTVID